MPEVPESIFLEGLKELIKLEKDWIPTSEGGALYIRPFMFSTDEFIGVKPSENYRFMIFCCPVNKYYNDPVRVKIEMKFSRAFEGGTGYAKAAGNYGGAMYPAKIGQEEGYQQLIWTDAKEHKYIEESGTMNLIFRMGDTVFSPAVSGTILNGVTRNSILQLARDYGYKVEERKVLVDEIVEALKTGRIDEAFGAGTAATIAPIRSIGYNDVDYPLSDSETWTFANRAKNELEGIKKGLMKDTHHWNVRVL